MKNKCCKMEVKVIKMLQDNKNTCIKAKTAFLRERIIKPGNVSRRNKFLIFIAAPIVLFFMGCKNERPFEIKLIEAAGRCDMGKTQALINTGGNINLTDRYGYTALLAAVSNNNCDKKCHEVISYLLNHGAKTDYCDIYGNTALHLAVGSNSAEVVKLLINSGAQVNKANPFTGESVLFSAAAKGNVEISGILLKNKADPNMANIDGVYPLHQAAVHSSEIMSLLLQYGAKPNVCDKYGLTVLHAILLNLEDNQDQHSALEKIKLLLHYGVDINQMCPAQLEIPDSHIGFRKNRPFFIKPNEPFIEMAERLNYKPIADFLKNYNQEVER